MVIVEFRLGVKIGTAQQDAQAKINAIRADFPKDMEEPVIQRIDFSAMPIVSVAVESPTADVKTLSSLAEKVLKKRLENVPGVGQVTLFGSREYSMRVWLDPDKVAARNMTAEEVLAGLRQSNVQVAGGAVADELQDRRDDVDVRHRMRADRARRRHAGPAQRDQRQ